MSKRIGILLLVIAVLMLAAAVASFVYSAYRAWHAGEIIRDTVPLGQAYSSPLLSVDTSDLVQVALVFDVQSNSVQEQHDDSGKHYSARYNFPLSYQVVDADDALLFEQRCDAGWDSCGTRSTSNNHVDQHGGTVTVEHAFDKFRVPPPGQIRVRLLVEPDPSYGASARHIELVVYDKVISHVGTVAAGIGLLLFAPLLLISGILLMVMPARSASPALSTGLDSDTRTWALFCHLSALLAYVGIPFGHLLGPLVIWLLKKDDDPFINAHGRESLNFQISITLYTGIAFLLVFAVVGLVLLPAIFCLHIVLSILAALRANDGQLYRYPLTIRLL